MRRWSIGTNDYYFTSSIYLQEAPWQIFAIERIMDFICHYFPRIPLPEIKIIRHSEKYTLRSYYGTTGDLFHVYVHDPVFQWCCRKIKEESIHFPFEELKKLFPNDFTYNVYTEAEAEEEEVKENKECSDKIGKEFIKSYNNLRNIFISNYK